MFEVLVGSRARRQVRASRGMVAAALHAVVIGGAIRATVQPVQPPRGPRVDTTRFEIFEPTPVDMSGPAAPGGVVALPPEMQSILPLAPGDIPNGIPPVDLGAVPINPAWLRVALGGPEGPGGGEGPISIPHSSAEVDVSASIIHQPSPRYPPVLRAAQREGRVLLEFVIDTLGHVEAGSLRVLERNDEGFVEAARESITRSLFRSATIAGRPVRQRTLQAVTFRIRPE